MKRLLLSTILGVFSLAASAQTGPEPSVRVPGYQIELPSTAYRMFPGDFDVYKGAYDMSNGDTMVLLSRGRHMYAAIGDGPRTELVAAAHNVFVAVDKQLKLTLNDEDLGPITGELLMVVPSQTSQANASGVEVVRLLTSR